MLYPLRKELVELLSFQIGNGDMTNNESVCLPIIGNNRDNNVSLYQEIRLAVSLR